MQLPRQNDSFAGEFHVEDELGSGGFAVVYRARWRGRVVALKVLRPQYDGYSLEVVARFNREAQILSQLQNRNVPTLFAHGTSPDGLLYLASEFVPGDDLRELTRRGPVSETLAEHVVREVLKPLAEAHAKGLLHRDIKPDNIRLAPVRGALPQVRLLDFGIARHANPEQGGRLTETGALVGTPRYMSPEQLMNAPLQASSDLYSLAIVGVEMLLGSEALHGGSLAQQVGRVAGAPAFEVPSTHGRLSELLEQMLAVQPGDRPPSATAALRVLNEEQPTTRLVAPARESSRARLITAFITLIALLTVVGFAVFLKDEPERHEEPMVRVNPLVTPPAEPTPAAADPTPAAAEPSLSDEPDGGALSDPTPSRPRGEHCAAMQARDSGTLEIEGPHNPLLGKHAVLYQLPRGYDPTRKYPVVLLFHDVTPDMPRSVLDASEFGRVASREGFVVIAPGDAKLVTGTAWTRQSEILVKRAVEAVNEIACLDLDAIYAVGNGRGGRAAMYTPCMLREVEGARVRAVATNGWRSNYLDAEVPDCDMHLPYLHVIGLLDEDVPVEGGGRCSKPDEADFTPLADHHAYWRKQLRCGGPSRKWGVDERCRTWTCQKPYVTCEFEGHGRSWRPIRINCPVKGPPTPELADKMWRFFRTFE